MSNVDSAATERVSAVYDDFGRRWAHGTSPLYEDWACGIARHPDLCARIAALPRRLQQPNLLFAASRWAGCALEPSESWIRWLRSAWDDVIAIATERSVQTNEPNRCATLLPVLSRLDGPVALLETGTAAGLCLFPDHYSVDYAAPSGPRRVDPHGGATSFALACEVDADASVPERMPDVVWRRGIDLDPIDATDDDAIAWLANLVWPGPDHDARVERLRGAAAIVGAAPPRIEPGDIIDLVTPVAAEAPREATLVIFHSAVLLYLDAEARRRFADTVMGLSARLDRPVLWLSNETAGTLPEIDARVPAGLAVDHRFVQTVDAVPVALAGQHGAVYETSAFRGA
ncbi:DUF2332 domain-containing protein [Microbacterium sp. 1P10UB]|uniref:DUF2332 domain-containing protein n=1 Tax=unclassified Microbacterium TaxID=2609290 RepID=UPI0039A1E3F9